MTLNERCNLVLFFARTLFINGQATDQTVRQPLIALRAHLVCVRKLRHAGENYNFSPTARTGYSSHKYRLIPRVSIWVALRRPCAR